MLTERETVQKLREYGDIFRRHVRNREFGMAHNIYNTALAVAVFMDMTQEVKEELFGEYGEEDEKPKEGIFHRLDVDRVNKECCIRRHMAYEDVECRKLGQPLRYYSDKDYCARCRSKEKTGS